MDLSNKVALITGGTSGIGLAIARQLCNGGARVIVTGTNETRLGEVVNELADGVDVVQTDFRDAGQVGRLFTHIAEQYGQLELLFANAGVGTVAPLAEVSEEEIDRLFDINFKGVFLAIQKAVPLMKSGSSIVVTTSFLNQVGAPGFSILSATKAALRSLVRTLGAELASSNIRINAVSPGPISTPFHSKLGLSDQQLSEAATDIESQVPLGRFGEPEEVARAAVFLASDSASFVTGTELVVDGGLSQF